MSRDELKWLAIAATAFLIWIGTLLLLVKHNELPSSTYSAVRPYPLYPAPRGQ